MQNRVKIDCTGWNELFDRAISPDGDAYDYCCGACVYAVTSGSENGNDYSDEWIYTGPVDGTKSTEHVVRFDSDGAERLIGRIRSIGTINTKYWWHVRRNYRNDIPDYVTNWWRPEYN
jgi:hypothetical protein